MHFISALTLALAATAAALPVTEVRVTTIYDHVLGMKE